MQPNSPSLRPRTSGWKVSALLWCPFLALITLQVVGFCWTVAPCRGGDGCPMPVTLHARHPIGMFYNYLSILPPWMPLLATLVYVSMLRCTSDVVLHAVVTASASIMRHRLVLT